MRALPRLLLPVLALSGAALAQPAQAGLYCVGEASTFVACVEAPDPVVGSRVLCVYVASGTCTPMTVPTAGLVGGPADVNCGGGGSSVQAFCYRVVNPLI